MIPDDLDAVVTLSDFGADTNYINDGSDSPLGRLKSSEVCKAPLDAGTESNTRVIDYQTALLHMVCYPHGNVEAATLLIEADIHVDSDDKAPLINAVLWNLIATAERLIEPGADVNARNFFSRDNTIHFAVNRSHKPLSRHTPTVNILNDCRVTGLGFFLQDVNGKAPTDQLAECEVSSESEIGFHEVFEVLARIRYRRKSKRSGRKISPSRSICSSVQISMVFKQLLITTSIAQVKRQDRVPVRSETSKTDMSETNFTTFHAQHGMD